MSAVAAAFAEESAESGSSVLLLDTASESESIVSRSSLDPVVQRWVTFHQGYSYEDFVVGLRPETISGSSLSLRARAGVLLELIAECDTSPGLLLIDEINRGNASKIFGEFITLMEPDKRLADDRTVSATTVTVTLPYLEPGEVIRIGTGANAKNISRLFHMPSNIYMLASMNSVDKSIAPLDAALRRRFHIINLTPSLEGLCEAVGISSEQRLPLDIGSDPDSVENTAKIAVLLVKQINEGISFFLGPDFALGQWYVGRLVHLDNDSAKRKLAEAWQFRILPQLLELFHGRIDALIELLQLGREDVESGLNIHQPDDGKLELGAVAYVTPAGRDLDIDRLFEFFKAYVGFSHASTEAGPA
jgi:hypothetical protein